MSYHRGHEIIHPKDKYVLKRFIMKRKCLLIDDDLDDQEIFIMTIQQLDAKIDCVAQYDCVAAIEQLRDSAEGLPDYIFLDMNMPKMTGLKCLEEIRKMPHLQHAKIIMYSTTLDESIKRQAMLLGADGFLIKQHTLAKLKESVALVFQK